MCKGFHFFVNLLYSFWVTFCTCNKLNGDGQDNMALTQFPNHCCLDSLFFHSSKLSSLLFLLFFYLILYLSYLYISSSVSMCFQYVDASIKIFQSFLHDWWRCNPTRLYHLFFTSWCAAATIRPINKTRKAAIKHTTSRQSVWLGVYLFTDTNRWYLFGPFFTLSLPTFICFCFFLSFPCKCGCR